MAFLVAVRPSRQKGVKPGEASPLDQSFSSWMLKLTKQAFVQNDAQAPPIASSIIRIASHHFGRHVLAGADDAVSQPSTIESRASRGNSRCRIPGLARFSILMVAFYFHPKLVIKDISMVVIVALAMRPMSIERKSKVGNLEVTRRSDEEVVGLDITMDPAHAMRLLNAHDHLGDVEARGLMAETFVTDENAQEVAADGIFHDEVKVALILEACHQGDDPSRILGRDDQEVPLCSQVTFLIVSKHFGLFDDFHCEDGGGSAGKRIRLTTIRHKLHRAEASLAEDSSRFIAKMLQSRAAPGPSGFVGS